MKFRLIESKQDWVDFENHVGVDLVKRFRDVKQRLSSPENDLSYWMKKEPEELEDKLNEFESKKTRAQLDDIAQRGRKIIYQDDDWIVMQINNYEASKKYGAKTRWCISGTRTYKSGKSGEDYFNQYAGQGIKIYFFINKYKEKFAMVVPGQNFCQIFDDQDRTIAEIPNAPDIPMFRDLEPLVEDLVYEDSEWKVTHMRNPQFARFYILARKGDEEDAYRYDIYSEMFMTPSQEFLDAEEFSDIDSSHKQIYDNFIVDLM